MLDYMNNFNDMLSTIFFVSFIVIVITIAILIILSLIMLAIGCLIKSQKIKSKFLKIVPGLIILGIFIILSPILYINIRNLV